MDAEINSQSFLVFGIFACVFGASIFSLFIWVAWAIQRFASGQPFLPTMQPRRWYVWGSDVIFCGLVFVIMPSMVVSVWNQIDPLPQTEVTSGPEHAPIAGLSGTSDLSGSSESSVKTNPVETKPRNDHTIIELLQSNPSYSTWLLAIYMVCILAPLNEELLFRGVLQGWFEGVVSSCNRDIRQEGVYWQNILIPGIIIFFPALFFAMMHFRSDHETLAPEVLLRRIQGAAIGLTLCFAVSLSFLTLVRGVRFQDIFGTVAEFGPRVRLGLLSWILVLAPVYFIQLITVIILKIADFGFAPDPFGLIPIACALGFVYYRTQSLVPSIVLHMLFNATGLLFAWASMGL